MTKADVVHHWKRTAEESMKAARLCLRERLFSLSLFHSHLAAEKGLKAAFIQEKDTAAPKTHNLWTIAEQLESIHWTDDDRKKLAELSTYAVAARYDDQLWMENEATEERASYWLEEAQHFLSRLP